MNLSSIYNVNKQNYDKLTKLNSFGGGKRKNKKLNRVSSNDVDKIDPKYLKFCPQSRAEKLILHNSVKLILSGTHDEIINNLHDLLMNDDTCDAILGSGIAGMVKVSKIGDSYILKYDNKTIEMPIVIKDAIIDRGLIYTKKDSDLFIHNVSGISAEALILYFIRPIIQLKLSPHLPLLLDHSKCVSTDVQPITRLITERHGLKEKISIPYKGFHEMPLWNNNNVDELRYDTFMGTFDDLCIYINILMTKDYTIKLPNDIVCKISELIDSISLSFLVTYLLLERHNIRLSDMHPQNIFIHWLDENSYLMDEKIGNVKYIFYKINNKIYKIKTFGILMKIGDVGACIVKAKSDVFIAGHCANIDKGYNIIKFLTTFEKNHEFFATYRNCLPSVIIDQLEVNKLFSLYPYNELHWMYMKYDHVDTLMNSDKMLDIFEKFVVSDIDETEDLLIFDYDVL